MPLTATLLSTPTFSWQGEPVNPRSRKALALLCYLTVKRGSVSREQLAELLWGAGKLSNVRQALYELRQLPGAENWLHDSGELVSIDAVTDLQALEQTLGTEHPDTAALNRAPLLAGLTVPNAPAFSDWLEFERERLHERILEAQTSQLARLEQTGHFAQALTLAQTLLADDPFNETLHRAVMRLWRHLGQIDKALEQFEYCREMLARELGVAPLPETLELLTDIEGGHARARQAVLLTQGSAIPNAAEILIGRRSQLDAVLAKLHTSDSVLVHGFGGMGKSALAAEVARLWLGEGKTALWLEVGSDTIDNLLDALVSPLGGAQQLAQAKDKPAAIKALLKQHAVSLIVLDDLRNAFTLSQLRDTLDTPLLITSRSRYTAIARVYLDRLPREASLELLSLHAKTPCHDDLGAQRLAQRLGDHAYALRLAGIILQQEGISAQALLERIRHQPHELRLPPYLSQSDESVAGLLEVSLMPLNDGDYEAFLAFGALPTPSATPELIARLNRREVETTENALFALVNRGLAERSAQPGSDLVRYRLHDLSHAYAKANTALRQQTSQRACLAYLRQHKRDVEQLELELANLLGAAEASPPDILTEFMWLLTVEGSYYTARGHSSRSLKLLERAVAHTKELKQLRQAHYLCGRLGDVHAKFTGNYPKALKAYEGALEFARRDRDTGREAVYLSLVGITQLYMGKDAAEHMRKALSAAQKTSDLLSRCTAYELRGYYFAERKDWEQARTWFERSLQTLTEHLEQRPTSSIDQDIDQEVEQRRFYGLLNLGGVAFELKNYRAAMTYRSEALAIATAQGNDLWQAHALLEIAEVQHAAQLDDPRPNLHRALQIYERNNATVYTKRVKAYMRKHNYL
jgi:DNA-binding SARP family transcriptional activator